MRKTRRTARIEARLTPTALATVKRAAEIQGRSISDFVVAAAYEAGQRVIGETQIISLSLADQEKVAAILGKPGRVTRGLRRALEAHRTLIRETR